MNRAGNENSRLVYSTDGGPPKPAKAERPVARKKRGPTKASAPAIPDDGVVRVMRSKTGRGGKTVTLVMGLPGSPAELEATLKDLKKQCGTGGTVEGRNLAIQGDQRERLVAALEKAGHRVKLAGG